MGINKDKQWRNDSTETTTQELVFADNASLVHLDGAIYEGSNDSSVVGTEHEYFDAVMMAEAEIQVVAQHKTFDEQSDDEESMDSTGPVAEAVAVATACPTSDTSVLSAEYSGFESQSYCRPEFSSATVYKPNPLANVGLSLKSVTTAEGEKQIVVSRVDPDGLFAKSNFCVGDQVLSIQNVSCTGRKMSVKKAALLISSAPSMVTVVTQNHGGDSRIVSCMVHKPYAGSLVGIGLKGKGGSVCVSRIDQNLSPFGQSLININDRCLYVNGIDVANMKPSVVGEFIKKAECVTIIAKPKGVNAMMVTPAPRENLFKRMSRVFVGRGATKCG